MKFKSIKAKAREMVKKHYFRNIVVVFVSLLIINGGYSYISSINDSNKNSLGTNFPITVKIETLISNGYLTPAEAKDPFHEKRTVCGHVVIENKNSFKFIDSTCNAACNSGEECVAITS